MTETKRWRKCDFGHLWFNCNCGSTLMLKKGKFDWYSPEKFLSSTAKGVFNQLANLRNLPHLPSTVMQLQQLLQDPNISPRQIASELKREPFIAASILQVAENLRNTRNPDRSPIKFLEHAIVYIGNSALSDIIMSAALRNFPIPKSGFDPNAFWEECFVTGAIAEKIAEELNLKVNNDEVYLSASLCNIGKLVTAICFPSLITKIIQDIKDIKKLPTWIEAEKNFKFPDHTILGEIAASIWGLPDFVKRAAQLHHAEPQKATVEVKSYELAAFANQMMHWILLQPSRMDEKLLEAFKSRLGLASDEVERLAEKLLELQKRIKTDIDPGSVS